MKLVIEIDGYDHELKKEKDAYRELLLRISGLMILRFTNYQVMNSIDLVLQEIAKSCTLVKTLPSP